MLAKMVHAPGKRKAGFVDGGVGKIEWSISLRHCERSEAIQSGFTHALDCRAAFGFSQ
ncbi:MAG: hypothetical protein JNN10_13400 [Sphingopyxis sp.]|uniref:hypothetical protein n=1 Tax=Sphingopyxis sp. TaxID=1908224 RepID=UPI001A58B650|nr:hypothetical protein [Sphingopyxis sp.]MBL9067279.1 hypothetical protein [Sphingopyxis sp.]